MLRNNKYIYILIVLISAIMLMSACVHQQAEPAADSEYALDYRVAGRDEGLEMMMANDAYYEGFTQNDLDFRMQKTGASMEEYKAFAKEQVLDFTDEQKKIIDEHMGRIEEIIAEKGYTIPEMEQIVFINTTLMRHL